MRVMATSIMPTIVIATFAYFNKTLTKIKIYRRIGRAHFEVNLARTARLRITHRCTQQSSANAAPA